MSIIDVDSHLVGEVVEGAVNVQVSPYDVADGSRRHEVLLTQTQALALCVVVVGVEHLGDSLRHDVPAQSLQVVALDEVVHAEGRNVSLPEPQLGNCIAAVAGNVHIVGDSGNDGAVSQLHAVEAVVPGLLQVAVEVYLYSLGGNCDQQCRAAGQPVVG